MRTNGLILKLIALDETDQFSEVLLLRTCFKIFQILLAIIFRWPLKLTVWNDFRLVYSFQDFFLMPPLIK